LVPVKVIHGRTRPICPSHGVPSGTLRYGDVVHSRDEVG